MSQGGGSRRKKTHLEKTDPQSTDKGGYAPHGSSAKTTRGLRHLGELQWASCTRGRGSPSPKTDFGSPPCHEPCRQATRVLVKLLAQVKRSSRGANHRSQHAWRKTLSFFGSNGPRWHRANVPFSLHPKARRGEVRCVLPRVRRSATSYK